MCSTSGTPRNVIDVLSARGLLKDSTGDLQTLREHCDAPVTVYTGFDPTADSLHVGNLLALITLAWFRRCGHSVVALVGGATGRVGDPSGKSAERPVLSEDSLTANLAGIRGDIETVLDRTAAPSVAGDVTVVDNYDWMREISFLDFLRDVGKHARVNTMMTKESVKKRLASEEGISFTEFTYQLVQAYDFMHLYQNRGVSLQLGGADQWGNIVAGTELTRKLCGATVHGVTFPLLTTSEGKKLGKSESGAVWLSSEKLSAYEFYQYFFRTLDADVGKMLRMLTFVPLEEIEALEQEMRRPGYVPNTGQRRLADEVTRIVHGEVELRKAQEATAVAAPGSKAELSVEALEAISADMPSVTFAKADVVGHGVVDVMVASGLQKSKGEARRLVKNGGAYVNNKKVGDEKAKLAEHDLVGCKLILLAAGKKNKMLVKVEG